jgi:hypothetical protein
MHQLSKYFSFLFLFLCLFIFPLNSYEVELAIATVFKNNAPFLKEWIEYHRLQGVKHFYLYNNSSTDDYKAVLKKYIKKGLVTLTEWPTRQETAWVKTTQLPAFQHACRLAKGKAKWLALIDSDEFLVPVKDAKFLDFLKCHEMDPVVSLFWQVYGTSGVYEIPPGRLMIELLTWKCRADHGINGHLKMIVRPEEFKSIPSPHQSFCKNGLSSFSYIVPLEEARINHYINRTIKFFYENKIIGKETIDDAKWSEEYTQSFLELGNEEEDRIMDRFIPALKARMGFAN